MPEETVSHSRGPGRAARSTQPAPASEGEGLAAAARRDPFEWASRAALVLAPAGIIAACIAIPAGVDDLPSRSRIPHLLDIVAQHAGATRAGFLAFAAGMVLMIPALSILRQSVRPGRPGQALAGAGARLAAVATGAAAIGDSFAPATLPTAVRPNLPRAVMITYVGDHLLNSWDWVIIAFYPLLPLGALLLAAGLWRNGALDRLTIVLVTLPLLALIAAPLELPTIVLGIMLEIGFIRILIARNAPRSATFPVGPANSPATPMG
jgi:hypothetical protein